MSTPNLGEFVVPAAATILTAVVTLWMNRSSAREERWERRRDSETSRLRSDLTECEREMVEWREKFYTQREKNLVLQAQLERLGTRKALTATSE